MTDEQKLIENRRLEWIEAVNANDINQYLDLLTEEILWFPPKQPGFQGKKAFESWLRPYFKRFRYKFSIRRPKLQLAGGWALERGAFQTKIKSFTNGKPREQKGRYMVIWRKDKDNVWRLDCYIDESNTEVNRFK